LSIRILIVDDDETNIELLTDYLDGVADEIRGSSIHCR
jgi:CheY-like chemotaxis protein